MVKSSGYYTVLLRFGRPFNNLYFEDADVAIEYFRKKYKITPVSKGTNGNHVIRRSQSEELCGDLINIHLEEDKVVERGVIWNGKNYWVTGIAGTKYILKGIRDSIEVDRKIIDALPSINS
jgi:hypothetical protein